MEEGPINIGDRANYEGNDTLLLIERVSNPIIFNQIIDLLLENEQARAGETVQIHEQNEDGTPKYDLAGQPVIFEGRYKPRSREELEVELRRTIETVQKDTPISFDPADKSTAGKVRELVAINQCFPDQPRFTVKQLSIVEAHEKGHLIRRYVGPFFNKYFSGTVDPVELRPYIRMNIEKYKGRDDLWPKNEKGEPKTVDEMVEYTIAYNTSAPEIAERMSQLKNYFGVSGEENFTKEHLDYTRQHYIEDTGMNNNMAAFFSMITPEKEEEFLRIINSVGI